MTKSGPRTSGLAGELFAGVGLGTLLGLLVGLAVSSVVATIVGALGTLLAAFFGLHAGSGPRPAPSTGDQAAAAGPETARALRAGGFGFACAVAVVLGVLIRTHGLLSVPVAEQIAALKGAGYSETEARQLVAYREFGLVPSGWSAASGALTTRMAKGGLFASGAQDKCAQLERDRYASLEEELKGYRLAGEAWSALADAVDRAPAPLKRSLLDAAWNLACSR